MLFAVAGTAFKLVAWAAGAFSLLFALASIVSAYGFFKLRRRAPAPAVLPPVTILKPLKGLDRGLYENLESFCRLDYPKLQLLFTLSSPDDPALPVVSRLRAAHPELDIEIIVSKNRIGFNPKINNVSNAEPFIKHDHLLISDSDIRVRPGFLRRMAAGLADRRVGMVTAFYQSTTPRGLWNRLEALAVNAHFLPQAVVAAACGMRFAMGAAMLVRREAFERAGGFQLMAGHLADDFILGEGIRKAGYRLELCDEHVELIPGVDSGVEHLKHQARWARTIRICNPGGYAGMAALHGFSLLCLKAAFFGPDRVTLALLVGVLAAKALSKTCLSLILGDRQAKGSIPLMPLSEWTAFAAWLSGFASTQVVWRGEAYVLPEPALAAKS